MNEKQNQPSQPMSKTHQNFRIRQSLQMDLTSRNKAASSKYSAYTTSKKKLSQIHLDLAQLECKFSKFQDNLNMMINCDNRSSQIEVSNKDFHQTERNYQDHNNELLFDLNQLDQSMMQNKQKPEQQLLILQCQPKPFMLSKRIENVNIGDANLGNLVNKEKNENKENQMKKMSLKRKELKKNQNKNQSKIQSIPKKKIDKTYAMRNFPMEYFDNVELLFQIMNRKKNRIKFMHQKSSVTKNKERRTLGVDKQNRHTSKQKTRMYSEENEKKNQQTTTNQQKITFFQLQNQNTFLQSQRKFSKDTGAKNHELRQVQSSITNQKQQKRTKYFSPKQQTFINKNRQDLPTTVQNNHYINRCRLNNNETQQNNIKNTKIFVSTNNNQIPLKSNRNKHPALGYNEFFQTYQIQNQKVLHQNNEIQFQNIHNQSQTTQQFKFHRSPPNKNQYVQRIMQTKTADQNSRRNKHYLNSNSNLFTPKGVTPSTTNRNTGEYFEQQPHHTPRQFNIKTAQLDITGIFSTENNFKSTEQQFNNNKREKQCQIKILSKHKQQNTNERSKQSFLLDINNTTRDNKKYHYCSCCTQNKQQQNSFTISPNKNNIKCDHLKQNSRDLMMKISPKSKSRYQTERENTVQTELIRSQDQMKTQITSEIDNQNPIIQINRIDRKNNNILKYNVNAQQNSFSKSNTPIKDQLFKKKKINKTKSCQSVTQLVSPGKVINSINAKSNYLLQKHSNQMNNDLEYSQVKILQKAQTQSVTQLTERKVQIRSNKINKVPLREQNNKKKLQQVQQNNFISKNISKNNTDRPQRSDFKRSQLKNKQLKEKNVQSQPLFTKNKQNFIQSKDTQLIPSSLQKNMTQPINNTTKTTHVKNIPKQTHKQIEVNEKKLKDPTKAVSTSVLKRKYLSNKSPSSNIAQIQTLKGNQNKERNIQHRQTFNPLYSNHKTDNIIISKPVSTHVKQQNSRQKQNITEAKRNLRVNNRAISKQNLGNKQKLTNNNKETIIKDEFEVTKNNKQKVQHIQIKEKKLVDNKKQTTKFMNQRFELTKLKEQNVSQDIKDKVNQLRSINQRKETIQQKQIKAQNSPNKVYKDQKIKDQYKQLLQNEYSLQKNKKFQQNDKTIKQFQLAKQDSQLINAVQKQTQTQIIQNKQDNVQQQYKLSTYSHKQEQNEIFDNYKQQYEVINNEVQYQDNQQQTISYYQSYDIHDKLQNAIINKQQQEDEQQYDQTLIQYNDNDEKQDNKRINLDQIMAIEDMKKTRKWIQIQVENNDQIQNSLLSKSLKQQKKLENDQKQNQSQLFLEEYNNDVMKENQVNEVQVNEYQGNEDQFNEHKVTKNQIDQKQFNEYHINQNQFNEKVQENQIHTSPIAINQCQQKTYSEINKELIHKVQQQAVEKVQTQHQQVNNSLPKQQKIQSTTANKSDNNNENNEQSQKMISLEQVKQQQSSCNQYNQEQTQNHQNDRLSNKPQMVQTQHNLKQISSDKIQVQNSKYIQNPDHSLLNDHLQFDEQPLLRETNNGGILIQSKFTNNIRENKQNETNQNKPFQVKQYAYQEQIISNNNNNVQNVSAVQQNQQPIFSNNDQAILIHQSQSSIQLNKQLNYEQKDIKEIKQKQQNLLSAQQNTNIMINQKQYPNAQIYPGINQKLQQFIQVIDLKQQQTKNENNKEIQVSPYNDNSKIQISSNPTKSLDQVIISNNHIDNVYNQFQQQYNDNENNIEQIVQKQNKQQHISLKKSSANIQEESPIDLDNKRQSTLQQTNQENIQQNVTQYLQMRNNNNELNINSLNSENEQNMNRKSFDEIEENDIIHQNSYLTKDVTQLKQNNNHVNLLYQQQQQVSHIEQKNNENNKVNTKQNQSSIIQPKSQRYHNNITSSISQLNNIQQLQAYDEHSPLIQSKQSSTQILARPLEVVVVEQKYNTKIYQQQVIQQQNTLKQQCSNIQLDHQEQQYQNSQIKQWLIKLENNVITSQQQKQQKQILSTEQNIYKNKNDKIQNKGQCLQQTQKNKSNLLLVNCDNTTKNHLHSQIVSFNYLKLQQVSLINQQGDNKQLLRSNIQQNQENKENKENVKQIQKPQTTTITNLVKIQLFSVDQNFIMQDSEYLSTSQFQNHNNNNQLKLEQQQQIHLNNKDNLISQQQISNQTNKHFTRLNLNTLNQFESCQCQFNQESTSSLNVNHQNQLSNNVISQQEQKHTKQSKCQKHNNQCQICKKQELQRIHIQHKYDSLNQFNNNPFIINPFMINPWMINPMKMYQDNQNIKVNSMSQQQKNDLQKEKQSKQSKTLTTTTKISKVIKNKKYQKNSNPDNKIIQAEIINYIKNYQTTSIQKILVKNNPIITQYQFQSQFKMAIKLLKVIDIQDKFIKRIFQTSSFDRNNQNQLLQTRQIKSFQSQLNNKDILKLWLFPNQLQYKNQSTFQPYQIIRNIKTQEHPHTQLTIQEMINILNHAINKITLQFKYEEGNMVKQIIQIITGATLFSIKPSSFTKLKNLHKHQNIKGFTFSLNKNQLYEIIGSEEIQAVDTKQKQVEKIINKIVHLKKCSTEKKHLENNFCHENVTTKNKEANKQTINVKWQDFTKNFTNSLIGVFGTNYQIRGLHMKNQSKDQTNLKVSKQKKSFIFNMQLKNSSSSQQNSKQKHHCLINVNMFGSNKLANTTTSNFNTLSKEDQTINNKGRILIYHQKQQGSNKFKYVGSGDLTFISMRIKQGKYVVILEFSKKTLQNMQQGKIIINYSGKSIELSEEKWTHDQTTTIATENTEFIKTNNP